MLCHWDTDATTLILSYLWSKDKNIFLTLKTDILLHKNVHMQVNMHLNTISQSIYLIRKYANKEIISNEDLNTISFYILAKVCAR